MVVRWNGTCHFGIDWIALCCFWLLRKRTGCFWGTKFEWRCPGQSTVWPQSISWLFLRLFPRVICRWWSSDFRRFARPNWLVTTSPVWGLITRKFLRLSTCARSIVAAVSSSQTFKHYFARYWSAKSHYQFTSLVFTGFPTSSSRGTSTANVHPRKHYVKDSKHFRYLTNWQFVILMICPGYLRLIYLLICQLFHQTR